MVPAWRTRHDADLESCQCPSEWKWRSESRWTYFIWTRSADPGFWDVLEYSRAPVIASHSSVRGICNHSRNLTDEQIRALIANDGAIGLTFVDFFTVSEKRKVWIDDLLRHLDHICALGGVDHVRFGSDFDGITETFGDMASAADYSQLLEALLKRYKEAEVLKFVQ
ncbi:membrane dipeptidase [Brevibacillus formosus]|uniref:dipeptidase n=1 Tax=Brevibacillus formosus TaxID=54913 RepID=UPI0021013A34|nr:membrane dipeptidase [Brevibacillus formosus]